MKTKVLSAAAFAAIVGIAVLWAGDEKTPPAEEGKAQTVCPVMGGKIDRSLFVDVEGKRIFVCCKGCIPEIEKDPAGWVKKIEEKGILLEKAPAPEEKAAPKSLGGKGGCSGGTCKRF